MLFLLYPTTHERKSCLTELAWCLRSLASLPQAKPDISMCTGGAEMRKKWPITIASQLLMARWIWLLISRALWAHKWDDFTLIFLPIEKLHYRNIRLELMAIWPEIKIFYSKGLLPVDPQAKWIRVHHRYYRGELPICWILVNFWVSICRGKCFPEH